MSTGGTWREEDRKKEEKDKENVEQLRRKTRQITVAKWQARNVVLESMKINETTNVFRSKILYKSVFGRSSLSNVTFFFTRSMGVLQGECPFEITPSFSNYFITGFIPFNWALDKVYCFIHDHASSFW